LSIYSPNHSPDFKAEVVRVSVAIPLFNEASVVPELLDRLTGVLDQIPGSHEIVFADDGSTDSSVDLLAKAAATDPRIRVVSLSRNFGHQSAISAALDHTVGDVVIVMDADLQDSPEAIINFLAEYRRGYDVVYAVRSQRKENSSMRFLYAAFYRIIAALSETKLPLDAGDFALISRRVVDLIRTSPERQRFLRGLRTWYGFEQKGIPIPRARRHSGEPKYSFAKLFRLAFDGIFAFSIVPLRLAAMCGAFTIFLASCYAVYATYVRLSYPAAAQAPPGFTALILAITVFSGVQLVFMGIVGEYVGRIYEEVKQRPVYVVKNIIETPQDPPS